MARGKSISRDPLAREDILKRVELTRKLVALAAHQHAQAKTNLDLAALGLAELETDLSLGGAQ